PLGQRGPGAGLQARLDREQVLGRRLDGDLVAGPHVIARDVHDPAVYLDVPVPHELPRLAPALTEAEPEDDVVEPRLERDEEVLARHAGHLGRPLEEVPELLLVQPVDPLHLLLLAELHGVLGLLAPALLRGAVMARRVGPTVDGALLRVALLALQEQLLAFTPAELADGSGMTRHVVSSDPTLLRRPAPVVRQR